MKVLLADDSVPAQNMGKKILVDAGYDVLTASNGLDAWRKIADSVPDIAILDIFMPGYSGLELCARIRGAANTATLPVILTVGKLEPYRPEDGEHVHSNAVIVKPFAAHELISAVRSLIGSPVPAEAAHEPEAESLPLEPAADPLQAEPLPLNQLPQNHLAPLPTDSGDVLGAADPLGEAALAEAAPPAAEDEPLFANASAATDDVLGTEQVAYYGGNDEPLLGGVDEGRETLAFNPDAAHTPFSASAADFMPQNPPAPESESPFSEFDLEPASPSITTPPPSAFAEPLLAMPEAVVGSTGNVTAEATAHIAQPPEESVPVPAVGAADPAANAVDEEARRQAFEELFNSSEPIPLDEDEEPIALADAPAAPVPVDGDNVQTRIFRFPNIAESVHEPLDVAPDSEIEVLSSGAPAESVASEPDPNLVEEAPLEQPEPAMAAEPVTRDVLMDQEAEPVWGEQHEEVQPSAESFTSALYPSQPGVLAPDVLAAPTYPAPEAVPELAASLPAELAQAAPEAVPEFAVAPEPLREVVLEHVPEPVHEVASEHVSEPVHEVVSEAIPEPVEAAPAEIAHAAPEAIPELVAAAPEELVQAAPEAVPEFAAAPEPLHEVVSEHIPEPVHELVPEAAASAVEVAPAEIAHAAPEAVPEFVVTPEPLHEAASNLVAAVPEASAPVETHFEAEAVQAAPEAVPELAAIPELAPEPVHEPAPEAAPEAVEAAPPQTKPHLLPELLPLSVVAAGLVAAGVAHAAKHVPAPEAVLPPVAPGLADEAPGLSHAPSELPLPETSAQVAPAPPQLDLESAEAERIRLAVDRVFDRFKNLLVRAIVRELKRED
jgi:CheY-like chemotaxis protein